MSDRLLVSTRKGLFTLARDRAGGWDISATAFLGDNVSLTLTDPRSGYWYAALDLGHFGVKLRRSRDAGATWDEVAAPALPPKPDGAEDVDPTRGTPVPWTVLRLWALAAGPADDPGGLWCGTIPGALFRSTDHGESWQLVESLWHHPKRREWFGGGADHPGIHSICVHPQRPDEVWLGVSCGGVWYTADRGASWLCRADGMRAEYMPPERAYEPFIQDPHRLVQCPARPEVLWAAHHNGIFRSVDGGRQWRELADVPPSPFGFAAAVHPTDPDTAWFVPADDDARRVPVRGEVVVIRTRDGGQTFDVLRDGLPQRHAYDLTYRHALDVDASGRRLAFGTTTGSLFLSENGGDGWTALSHHLPPIYAVGFVAQG